MHMHQITLYTRNGCHLCEVAHEALERVRAAEPFALDVVDVDTDEKLKALYGFEVPVIAVDGKKWAKFRFEEAALLRRLRAPDGDGGEGARG